jgi:hypothetical protein
MKAGDDVASSRAISRWKSRDMYWLLWLPPVVQEVSDPIGV